MVSILAQNSRKAEKQHTEWLGIPMELSWPLSGMTNEGEERQEDAAERRWGRREGERNRRRRKNKRERKKQGTCLVFLFIVINDN